MQINQLDKIIGQSKKRLGRGHGSGRGGHTSSRGAKGDNARGKTKLLFEGTKTKKSLIKRLPFLRGKDKLRTRDFVETISLSQLGSFKPGETVNSASLYKKGLTDRSDSLVKLLANGEINIALEIDIPCSKQAGDKIRLAGGKILDPLDRNLLHECKNHDRKVADELSSKLAEGETVRNKRTDRLSKPK